MRFSNLKNFIKESLAAFTTFASGKRLYQFTTAITANTTVTTAPAGSLATTTHATGRMSIFVSDGSKWQYLTNS